MIVKPSATDYPGFFQRYITLVPQTDLFEAFAVQREELAAFLLSISDTKADYSYAPGKWTLKELLQHIIDTERIFAYRALCFARGEQQNLPGFDENNYAANAYAANRNWQELVNEFITLRQSTEQLFNSLNVAVLTHEGHANNTLQTVAGVGFTVLGHFIHHKNIITQRYL
ncbi:MAG: hypothetical protein RL172_976 [Bacteroidota bacterium]|jgi:uncharacterized damage-inducible protein DinB